RAPIATCAAHPPPRARTRHTGRGWRPLQPPAQHIAPGARRRTASALRFRLGGVWEVAPSVLRMVTPAAVRWRWLSTAGRWWRQYDRVFRQNAAFRWVRPNLDRRSAR